MATTLTFCKGCQSQLQVGAVPDELFLPMPGINVWCIKKEKKPNVVIGDPEINDLPLDKHLNLCLTCFNGYVTGKVNLSLETLGISVVKAPYNEEDKCLKIMGPTKFVNLLSEPTEKNPEREATKESANEDKRAKPNVTQSSLCVKNLKGKRKQSGSVKCIEVTSVNRQQGEQGNPSSLRVSNAVDYLSVGTGSLGAIEMTDDEC